MLSLLLALTGCAPAGEIETGASPDDTSESPETGDRVDPKPDLSVWMGQRTFITDDCEEPATEIGHELTADTWNDYEDTKDECPNCDHIYYVEVSPDTICGVPVTQERYRGVDFMDEGKAIIYDFGGWSGAEILDPDAQFDGWTLTYSYDYSSWLSMEGVVEYPEAE